MYGGASWFLLLQERVEYSYATLICKLHDLGGRQDPLVAKDTLEILGVRGNLHSIKKWYVAINFLITSTNLSNCSSATGLLFRSRNGKAVVS